LQPLDFDGPCLVISGRKAPHVILQLYGCYYRSRGIDTEWITPTQVRPTNYELGLRGQVGQLRFSDGACRAGGPTEPAIASYSLVIQKRRQSGTMPEPCRQHAFLLQNLAQGGGSSGGTSGDKLHLSRRAIDNVVAAHAVSGIWTPVCSCTGPALFYK